MQGVIYYFIAVSVIGAAVCLYDKGAAAHGWALLQCDPGGAGLCCGA